MNKSREEKEDELAFLMAYGVCLVVSIPTVVLLLILRPAMLHQLIDTLIPFFR